jgi:hypothetical protein
MPSSRRLVESGDGFTSSRTPKAQNVRLTAKQLVF